MKFQHDFKLITKDNKASTFNFKEADNNIQIDFFKHIMRVAMFKDNAFLMPTFSVCPGDCKMPQKGRAKLSDEGFEREIVKREIPMSSTGMTVQINFP